MPLSIEVQGQEIMVVEEFVYLGHHSCCHIEREKPDLEVMAR